MESLQRYDSDFSDSPSDSGSLQPAPSFRSPCEFSAQSSSCSRLTGAGISRLGQLSSFICEIYMKSSQSLNSQKL